MNAPGRSETLIDCVILFSRDIPTGCSLAQDGGEISVRYLDVIGIARRLASMLGRCNNDDRKLGVSMLDRLPDAAHLAVCEDQRCPHSHLPL